MLADQELQKNRTGDETEAPVRPRRRRPPRRYPAAAATSLDGSWNPLMTTINEAERVPIIHLEKSLTRLCKVADSSTPYL